MENWIENLKVGDNVIVVYSGCCIQDKIETVSKITKYHIIVGGKKIRKKDCLDIAGRWSKLEIVEATPSRINKIMQNQKL